MEALSPATGSFQIDATAGGGGHAFRILEATSPDGRLLGLDADPLAIERTATRLARFGDRVVLRNVNFEQLETAANETGFEASDGVLFDLGLSSYQLAEEERGFSFRSTGRLDMRFDAESGAPASELLETLPEEELTHIFRTYGEEPAARRIARLVVDQRKRGPLGTPAELAALIERHIGSGPPGRRRIHPATRVFQALRIAVNRELQVLPTALAAALRVLRPGGRLVVISYHSLEDRIVKRFLADERRGCVCPPEVPVCVCGRAPRLRPLGRLQRPTDAEVDANPRSRSARLRAAERLAA